MSPLPLLELRPLNLSELLDRTFSLYRNRFWLFAGILVLPNIVMIGAAVLAVVFGGDMFGPGAGGETGNAINLDSFFTLMLGGLILSIIYLVGYAMAVGATVVAVSELTMGREPSLRESVRAVLPKTARLVGLVMIIWLGLMVGAMFCFVPGIYFLVRMSVAVPASVVENLGIGESLSRSVRLTQANAGRGFLILLLVAGLYYAGIYVSQLVIMIPMTVILKSPDMMGWMMGALYAAQFFVGVAIGPIGAIAFALFYYDLRMRKEAFDLQVMMQALGQPPAAPSGTAT